MTRMRQRWTVALGLLLQIVVFVGAAVPMVLCHEDSGRSALELAAPGTTRCSDSDDPECCDSPDHCEDILLGDDVEALKPLASPSNELIASPLAGMHLGAIKPVASLHQGSLTIARHAYADRRTIVLRI